LRLTHEYDVVGILSLFTSHAVKWRDQAVQFSSCRHSSSLAAMQLCVHTRKIILQQQTRLYTTVCQQGTNYTC